LADPNNGAGFTGFQQPSTSGDEFTADHFMIWSILARVRTATLVKVVGVTNSGADVPAGYVDIQPLVNQIDGTGNAVPHAVVYKCPYFRLQGGANAIILDPQVGDIGLAAFADRDISSATATQAQANPGSRRMFSMADGLYIGGFLGQIPTQFVQFNTSGIEIVSPTAINMTAPDIKMSAQTVEIIATTSTTVTTPTFTVNGNTMLNGTLAQGTGAAGGSATIQGPVTVVNNLTAQGTSVHTHTHGGVQTGGGNTGAPN